MSEDREKHSPFDTDAILVCIRGLLEIDPAKIGKIDSIRLIMENVSRLIGCDGVQVLELLESDQNRSTFLKYYFENKSPAKIEVCEGINQFCVVNRRFFLAQRLDHEKQIAVGISGSLVDKTDTREEVIHYVMMPPEGMDEESAVFYPLVSGDECIGTIKLCDYSLAERFTLGDVLYFEPVADAIKTLLHIYFVIDTLDKKNQEYETVDAAREEALNKLLVGEKLTYQFLMATSHLHELAALLAGMASDRMEFLSVVEISDMSYKLKAKLREIIDRYSQHRQDSYKKVRELLQDRPKKRQLFRKPHNVKDLINEQLDVYEPQFRNLDIRLKKSLGGVDLPVELDASAIKYVLRILLNNSIRALSGVARQNRRLGVFGKREGMDVVIRISDNGDGVEPNIRKKIFEAFYTTRDDGTGIGLFWAKKTIEEDHYGSLELVRSLPYPKTVFQIVLPI